MTAPLTPGNPLFTAPSASLNPEQDALRWRAVIDRLTALESLVRQSVKYNAPTPAGQEVVLPTIRGTNYNVSDGVRNRVQLGNLPTYTGPNGVSSPAQYGERVLDANGNVIFDTGGLSSVMSNLGVTDVGSNTFTSTTFATIPGSPFTFTLSRQANVLVIFGTTAYLTATGNIGFVRCNLDGAAFSGNLNFGTSNIITLGGTRFYPAVAAGAHTLSVEAAVSAPATTLNTTESTVQGFLLGA